MLKPKLGCIGVEFGICDIQDARETANERLSELEVDYKIISIEVYRPTPDRSPTLLVWYSYMEEEIGNDS